MSSTPVMSSSAAKGLDGSSSSSLSFSSSSSILSFSSVVSQYDAILLITIAAVAFYATNKALPQGMVIMRERGIFGIDINKVTLEDRQKFGECKREHKPFPPRIEQYIVPESAGTFVGLVYLCSIVVAFALLPGCPLDRCNAALCSMGFALLLGFVDDVLDVRWRYKIMFSAVTTLPLLSSYSGPLWIAVPIQLRGLVAQWLSPAAGGVPVSSTHITDIASAVEVTKRYIAPYLFPPLLDGSSSPSSSSSGGSSGMIGGGADVPMDAPGLYLGPLYLLYMSLVTIFCTNSINILAGVNGVEVGQTMVICVAQIIQNILSIYLYGGGGITTSAASSSSTQHHSTIITNNNTSSIIFANQSAANHRVSLIILVPFLAVCGALWRYNRYPSRFFVGDSFTYMAGVVLAVAGITGVYSKTLLLFFFPQLLNFVLSLPQLLGVVVCPRHRVPRYCPKDGLLHNSHNLTVLNLILTITGPVKEGTLTTCMLAFQAVSCAAALWLRHSVAAQVFEIVN